jgi:hypothetical protein
MNETTETSVIRVGLRPDTRAENLPVSSRRCHLYTEMLGGECTFNSDKGHSKNLYRIALNKSPLNVTNNTSERTISKVLSISVNLSRLSIREKVTGPIRTPVHTS